MSPPASSVFALGVNYPWLNYAHDFGASPTGHFGLSLGESREVVERDFAEIRETGASVVRWFLFGDGRSGFLSENGIPLRADSLLLKDTAALLAIAERFDLKVCLSLIDYLWLQDHGDQQSIHANERVL